MDFIIVALAHLILLKCSSIKLPPVCGDWNRWSCDELVTLHSVLCCRFHGDAAADNTVAVLRNVFNFRSLINAAGCLKEMWFRTVKKHGSGIPFSSAVLSVGYRMEKAMNGPEPIHFDDGSAGLCTWMERCQLALEALHSPDSLVSVDPLQTKNLAQPLSALFFLGGVCDASFFWLDAFVSWVAQVCCGVSGPDHFGFGYFG